MSGGSGVSTVAEEVTGRIVTLPVMVPTDPVPVTGELSDPLVVFGKIGIGVSMEIDEDDTPVPVDKLMVVISVIIEVTVLPLAGAELVTGEFSLEEDEVSDPVLGRLV